MAAKKRIQFDRTSPQFVVVVTFNNTDPVAYGPFADLSEADSVLDRVESSFDESDYDHEANAQVLTLGSLPG